MTTKNLTAEFVLNFANENKNAIITKVVAEVLDSEVVVDYLQEFGVIIDDEVTFTEDGNGDISINGSWFEESGYSILVDGTDRSDVEDRYVTKIMINNVTLEIFQFNI